MANNKTPVKAGETDIIAARREAAAKLLPLFGGKDAAGKEIPGVFHTHGIAAVVGASPDYKKFIDELRANPHARSLATVAAARGNKNFPPALVAEFLSGDERSPEEQRWFAEVYLGGLATIFAATGEPLRLPLNQAGLDLARGAWGVFSRLSDEERRKLGIGEEAPRRQLATDLLAIADEQPAQLTPVQRLYRWAESEMEARAERRAERRAAAQTEDAAAALPQAAPKPEPEAPAPAPTPAGPAIPDLSALTGGGEAKPQAPKPPAPKPQAPKTPAGKKAAPAPPAPAAPPPVEETKPATAPAAVDEDRELVFAAIRAAADGGNVVARAFLALKGEKATLEELVTFATRKGLL
jgi:hypothetical protein